MKRLNIFCTLLALLSLAVVSCSKTDAFEPGPQDVEGCYDVYFPKQENTGEISLDPAESTMFTYTALRTNTEGAITVPVKVSANTDGLYTFTEINFAEGEDSATFTVELSQESLLGVPYDFEITITDPQYVSQYSNDATKSTSLSLSITRVKWLDLGLCDYTDDIITSWWGYTFDGEWAGVTHPTYKVMVQVREDSINKAAFEAAIAGTGDDMGLVGIYRMLNPYLVGPWTGLNYGAPELEDYAYHIIINVEEGNKAWIPLQELGLTINGGMPSIYSVPGYFKDNDAWHKLVDADFGKIQNGQLKFGLDADGKSIVLGCPGGSYVGSNTYYANSDGAFCLNLAPALNRYVLQTPTQESDGDFTFEEVELGSELKFYSESQVDSWSVTLEVGTPSVTTDDADREFVATYGSVYRVPNLYAEDYPILFTAKGSQVQPVPGLEAQLTGLSIAGDELALVIDPAQSSFNAETYEFSLVADVVSAADDTVVYGTFREVLSAEKPEFEVAAPADMRKDFQYTTIFTDAFVSTIVPEEWDAEFQMGVCLDAEKSEAFDVEYGQAYCIPNLYANGYNFYFAAKEGKLTFPAGYKTQPMGISILGTPAYLNLVSGDVSEVGITFKAQVVDGEGNMLVPSTITEKLVTYKWNDVATGTWSNALGNSYSGRQLQQAEGTNLYRVLDFWGVADTSFVFEWDEKTNKCDVVGPQATGFNYGGNGLISLYDVKDWYESMGYDYSWAVLESNGLPQPTYNPETKTFAFVVKYALPALGPGVGYQSYYQDRFVLDAEPEVATWQDYAVGTFTHTHDFWLPSNYLPYPEEGVVMQRYGNTNKYKFAIAAGAMELLLEWDGQSAPVVLESETGESDEGEAIFCGDVYAAYTAWGATYTPEQIYAAYPNGYDAATKTLSLNLVYYSYSGYYFTSNPTAVHTFQITGEAGGATTASSAIFPRKNVTERKKMTDVKNRFEVKKEACAELRKIDIRTNGGVAEATPYKKVRNTIGKNFVKQSM